eukprot:SAG31_NODE_2242_length_6109_cov_18.408819_5_plen_106_part_00
MPRDAFAMVIERVDSGDVSQGLPPRKDLPTNPSWGVGGTGCSTLRGDSSAVCGVPQLLGSSSSRAYGRGLRLCAGTRGGRERCVCRDDKQNEVPWPPLTGDTCIF